MLSVQRVQILHRQILYIWCVNYFIEHIHVHVSNKAERDTGTLFKTEHQDKQISFNQISTNQLMQIKPAAFLGLLTC